MAVGKNVVKREKAVRIVIGFVLIAVGFWVTGFWRPVSICLGAFLLGTAFVGY